MSVAVITALAPALVFLASAVAPAASAGTAPPPPSGWTTAYSDSFAGSAGSGVDSGWTYDQGTQYTGTGCTGNWGTGEVESNTNSTANVSEDGNGDLNITPVDNGGSWTSGRIETVADDFEAPAGGEMEVSASIKQPNPSGGLGYWPAFWMLGAGFRASGAGTSGTMDCSNWPSAGEIDILEDVNALSEHSGTLHCGVDPGGPCNETDGLGSGLVSCSGCQTGYNTYSVIVNRTNTSDESITWYLNGNAYYTVTESQVGTSTWQAAVDHGFFLILDVAMGGAYPDAICGCTSPAASTSSGAAMSVNYVAVYTTTGSGGGGGTTAPAAPTGLTVTGTTSSSVSLSWAAPSGTVSGYYVDENGSQVASVTGTTATITGLAASTMYSFTVIAYNSAGESPPSAAVSATTSSSGGGGGGGGGTSCTSTATSDISADCYSASAGTISVTTTSDPAPSGVDGNQVAQLTNGDYLEYTGINFGSGSTQFDARVASGAAGGASGLVEVVLDNPANAPVGSFAVGNTGGWSSWETVPANISTVTGTHTVYLEFVSGATGNPPFVSLHYFSFPGSGGGGGAGGGGGSGGSSCTSTATSDISADCDSASHGTISVTTTSDPAPSGVDGNQVAQLTNGDYLEYTGINFGSGSTQFDARVASGAAGGASGLVEVVLDNPANAPVGSFAVGNTGGWSSWETVPANISTVTGTHTVYLEFVSGATGNPPFVSLHYFSFPAT